MDQNLKMYIFYVRLKLQVCSLFCSLFQAHNVFRCIVMGVNGLGYWLYYSTHCAVSYACMHYFWDMECWAEPAALALSPGPTQGGGWETKPLSGWEANSRSISSGRRGVTSLCWLKMGGRGMGMLAVPFPMGGLAAPCTCMAETTLPACACCPVEVLADRVLAGTCSASASCIA